MIMSLWNRLKVLNMINDLRKKLVVVGASGHGKVVADLAELLGFSVSFFDDAYPIKTQLAHWSIIRTFDDLLSLHAPDVPVVVAIGNNAVREKKNAALKLHKFEMPSLVHPTAIVSRYATLGTGSVVFAGAIINAFAQIGDGCIVNSAAIIEHDCVIGHHSHISPNVALAGGVVVGSGSWIGIGSQVKQLIHIGDNVVIGAGSTVIKDIPAGVLAYGCPATVVSGGN